ncbi:MAG: endoribonuclease MazF [Chloroflexota bacterium]
MSAAYVPDRGDIIWLDFDPQAGREQAGRWPALVLSPGKYNRLTSLALVCPITNQSKGYPYEVHLPAGLRATGVVLSDHIKNLDWAVRRAEYIDRLPDAELADVLAKIETLFT